ncbi:MAG: S8 family serine peptidase [Bacteroidales bacterium]|nr:S8 family serine peptidase [Bacteroidales bacterium]
MFRVILKDKGNTPFSIDKPHEFLSEKAIQRRTSQGFAVDDSDLPIDPEYFTQLENLGAQVRTCSKWTKTIVVNINNPDIKYSIEQLPFVESMTKVWEGDLSLWQNENVPEIDFLEKKDSLSDNSIVFDNSPVSVDDYGFALTQIRLNNGLPLHDLGYTGKGKTIAVIDGGFENVDGLSDYFDLSHILGVKNFSHNQGHPFRLNEIHGTTVLSCMLANNPGVLIGTAPDAHYYLFNTEVGKEEYPIEEDYWVAALEYADSLGVDIVTTSLGYSSFDDPNMNHSWDVLDGYTVPASRAASMAAAKGIVLFISSGNLGNTQWTKTTVPGDAKNILTVGAVGRDSLRASFSSWGNIADGRIKPDVMAMGQGVAAVVPSAKIISTSGTSFSTPLLAGMSACLWEALPHLNSLELMNLIKASSNKFHLPDKYFGYGLPDMYKAYQMGQAMDIYYPDSPVQQTEAFYVDYLTNILYMEDFRDKAKPRLMIYTLDGLKVFDEQMKTDSYDLSFLQKGMYILSLGTAEDSYIQRYIRK